jgi:DNA-binding transcriptional regulator/RsmH inhibitor MraZ
MKPVVVSRALDRGYVRVPKTFRHQFAVGPIHVACEVTVTGGTVVLMTEEIFLQRLATLSTRSKESIADHRTWLRFSIDASCVALGSEGRVRLPPQVVARAGLPARVTVVLNNEALELWAPPAFIEHLAMAQSLKPVRSYESVCVRTHHPITDGANVEWGVAQGRIEPLLNSVDMLVSQSPTERAGIETIGKELRVQVATQTLTEPALRYLLNKLSTNASATCTRDEQIELQRAIEKIEIQT